MEFKEAWETKKLANFPSKQQEIGLWAPSRRITTCYLVLTQEHPLHKLDPSQHTLSWNYLLMGNNECLRHTYFAEDLPVINRVKERPINFLHIPKGYTTLHPNHEQQLWNRFSSITHYLKEQGLLVRSFHYFENKETEFFPFKPLEFDLREYVQLDQPSEQTLETIDQILN